MLLTKEPILMRSNFSKRMQKEMADKKHVSHFHNKSLEILFLFSKYFVNYTCTQST